jgi:hypothetical protein
LRDCYPMDPQLQPSAMQSSRNLPADCVANDFQETIHAFYRAVHMPERVIELSFVKCTVFSDKLEDSTRAAGILLNSVEWERCLAALYTRANQGR